MTKTEQKVLQNLQLRFDEVEALKATLTTEEFFNLPKEEAKKQFEECLFWFFVDGYSSGILMLEADGLTEMPNGYEFLDIRYPDDETVLQKFDRYYDDRDAERMAVLMDSESHRMYGTGSTQAAADVIKAEPTSKVTKTWNTMMDERVRDQHWALQGQTIAYDDVFVTIDGDYGTAPGLFQTAENNANCRCWLSYKRTQG